ncbi:MAG: cobalamin biosynthesis protein CobD [Desulfobacterales bacterium]|uniref:Cobalamin biosynthesis protein CobD n=1 Tax=Candidatus Desulfaltia bathyphila TaxID=2841697 RepID=A0A8J6N4H9_9BACT|nr:cobalamin biosynthesis protein CobD [Candidatus Desulfaltia bathyphila]MBL7195263.1 cobalamin biosynthesis protein CobD [Desulfobacterales bacterium]MBL7207300.1 cobalamin biosynthesis protein CobD [Desulfobacterales bacterium]
MTPAVFLGAYIVDIIIGDPRWFPHPVVIIGKSVRFLEDKIRRTSIIGKKKGGIILWFAVVVPTFFITWGIVEGCLFINALFGAIITVLFASMTLATRSLFDESKAVIDALNNGNIVEARKKLSMIVGRDTENLDEQEICRAVIETVSENLSDGIVAPMFYLVLGGLPLAMAYKAANTLDSMVGYKNDRYGDIGWFSAKMDDMFNWVPARLTGLIIMAVSFILRLNWRDSWKIMRRDGQNHSSPNSGTPEAATAGALNIQLGGKIQYFGKISHKPTIGDRIKEIDRDDVKKVWVVMFISSFLMAAVCVLTLWMI